MEQFLSTLLALLVAPLFPALTLKVKAFLVGKQGPPLLIKYFTLWKLMRKGAVYGNCTSLVSRLSPSLCCAASIFALCFLPLAAGPALLAFHGDVILVIAILALARFSTIVAALDSGSPFQGMGAAREAFFGIFGEITLFAIVIFLYRISGSLSLTELIAATVSQPAGNGVGALLPLLHVALFMVLLVENCRVPVDDPATHLELTMIHEVMILDLSGPDLALAELAAQLKLLFYASFLALALSPFLAGLGLGRIPAFYAMVSLVYLAVGVVESATARLRLTRVPKFILTATTLVFFAAILAMEVL